MTTTMNAVANILTVAPRIYFFCNACNASFFYNKNRSPFFASGNLMNPASSANPETNSGQAFAVNNNFKGNNIS